MAKMVPLIALRKAAGYRSARAFAEAVGISVGTYTHYEQGNTPMPLEAAWKIADFLDCSLDALVGRVPPQDGLDGGYAVVTLTPEQVAAIRGRE